MEIISRQSHRHMNVNLLSHKLAYLITNPITSDLTQRAIIIREKESSGWHAIKLECRSDVSLGYNLFLRILLDMVKYCL
jgi:hypothetical protein